jgi:peptidoglycan LD-endopeptidase LytH
MTRFGWIMLGLFALLGAALVTMLGGEGPAVRTARPPATMTTERAVEVEPVASPSGLIVPVAGVRTDQLYDSWGDERGGGTRAHQALDIPAPRGTPVLAAAAGRVDKLWTSGDGGLTVYVRGEDGRFQYYYAHLDRYIDGLAEGQRVTAGQPIATVGDSGNAGAGNTHLHFGISAMGPGDQWHEGRPINPYPLLAR